MRIVLDLQGAQSDSRVRGIGRYSLNLALAIARQSSGHEIIVALNGMLVDAIEPIRAAFEGLHPQTQIRVWHAAGPVADVRPDTTAARLAAEHVREAFLASLSPDIVHVSSVFEGFGDDAVTSIGGLVPDLPTAVTLYDLIPLSVPHPNPTYRAHYERKLLSFRRADLWLGISQYSCDEAVNALSLPPERVVNISCAADRGFGRVHAGGITRSALMQAHHITRPFVCAVGAPEERKNLDMLFRAFVALRPDLRRRHQLVLVGHMQERDRQAVAERAHLRGLSESELVFTGHVTDRDLVLLYNSCQAFVFPSLYEGFGLPALEAMQCGAPVIASNATSVPEVVGLDDALFDARDADAATLALTRVLSDDVFRSRLVEHGLTQSARFSWDHTAHLALDAMERCHAGRLPRAPLSRRAFIDAVAAVLESESHDTACRVASAMAQNEVPARGPMLFVDVSELAQRDAGTGVQRVTRSVLNELLRTPPPGYTIAPIYASPYGGGYRHANRFVEKQFGTAAALDLPVEYREGDIFLGLDLQHEVVIAHRQFYAQLRACGVGVYFVVYDLLPVALPQYFPGRIAELHDEWLTVISSHSNGLICISRDVADQLLAWIDTQGIRRHRPLHVGWAHCGADIASSLPTRGVPDNAPAILGRLRANPSFLMVGTLEPRKGHRQVLDGFERLWSAGEQTNLVIVGRKGWMADEVIERLTVHPQRDARLFWLESVSDEFLDQLYAASSCLIAASAGEGYGLPLVEAARHGLPILARDLPVFREVAGTHASYFAGQSPEALAEGVQRWLHLHALNAHPRPLGITSPTWADFAARLTQLITAGEGWYTQWPAPIIEQQAQPVAVA